MFLTNALNVFVWTHGLRSFCDVVTSVATLLESLRMRITLLKANGFSVESTRVGSACWHLCVLPNTAIMSVCVAQYCHNMCM